MKKLLVLIAFLVAQPTMNALPFHLIRLMAGKPDLDFYTLLPGYQDQVMRSRICRGCMFTAYGAFLLQDVFRKIKPFTFWASLHKSGMDDEEERELLREREERCREIDDLGCSLSLALMFFSAWCAALYW